MATPTFTLPQDIFRVIFQYLTVKDLISVEKAFSNSLELLSQYQSALEGVTLKDTISVTSKQVSEITTWIVDRKVWIESVEIFELSDLVKSVLCHYRFSLKSIKFIRMFSFDDFSQLGHFPYVTAVAFESIKHYDIDKLVDFFSTHPQLEIVKMNLMPENLSDYLFHLSNSCPNLKILSLAANDWMDDEQLYHISPAFPNLKAFHINQTSVRNEQTLRYFIQSHPQLSAVSFPYFLYSSDDFIYYCFSEVVFPALLGSNLESQSLAIASLWNFLTQITLEHRPDLITPKVFPFDILEILLIKGCSFENLKYTLEIFGLLSSFPAMVDSILKTQFIPTLLLHMNPQLLILSDHLLDFLFGHMKFHEIFPLLVEKYHPHPYSLIPIYWKAIQTHFTLLSPLDLHEIITTSLNELKNPKSTLNCLNILLKLLQEPSTQPLIDSNHLIHSFKSFIRERGLFTTHSTSLFSCLKIMIFLKDSHQPALFHSNLLSQITRLASIPAISKCLMDFIKHCLLTPNVLVVDYLIKARLIDAILPNYTSEYQNQIEFLFVLLLSFNSKYYKDVREMRLPPELRKKLIREDS